MTSLRIAFLGIGLMGRHQAQRILEAGYDVTVWNRTKTKAEALEPHGAKVADTAKEAADGADVVITMVENGPVVGQVLFGESGAIQGLNPGAMVVDMSSIRPSEAREHAARLIDSGIGYVDAPVSGGTVGAEAGNLTIMCGGAAADYIRAEAVLKTMGYPTHVGPTGSGQWTKLANQMIVGITIGAVAEALALAERSGADPAKVREALRGGFADSRVLELHGKRMVERDFVTKGRTTTQVKDLENAMSSAAELSFQAPLLEKAAALFRSLAAHEGDPDHSALILEIERLNPKS